MLRSQAHQRTEAEVGQKRLEAETLEEVAKDLSNSEVSELIIIILAKRGQETGAIKVRTRWPTRARTEATSLPTTERISQRGPTKDP
jgi:hypothetical protein